MTKHNQIYQFRINLTKISPMIWRRVLISNDSTLADLHYVIQITMGWTNYHLNEFTIHGKRYTIANNVGMASANGIYGNKIKLNDLKLRLNQRITYEYDFTANWEFEIRLEKTLPEDQKKKYPTCISGSGTSPDEECGGSHRFNSLKSNSEFKSYEIMMEFLKAVADDSNSSKQIREVVDMERLQEANYWLNIDKYECKQVNKYLKFYANNDNRWQEAFDEVISL